MRSLSLFGKLFALVFMQACTSANFQNSKRTEVPKCTELRRLYSAASDPEFGSVRKNVEIRSDGSRYRTFEATLRLTGADSCLVRKYTIDFEYYCRWEAQDDDDKLVNTFHSIQAQLLSCLREADVSRSAQSVRAIVGGEDHGAEYYLTMSGPRSSTNYVALRVRRQDP